MPRDPGPNRMEENMTLRQLGFQPKKRTPTQKFFDARRGKDAVKPDIDWHPDAERRPQMQAFINMWHDEWSNIGNIKNPLGSPMESGV